MIQVTTSDVDYRTLPTAALRQRFLLDGLCAPGELRLARTDLDRAVTGYAVPTAAPLRLAADRDLRCATFRERREVGFINFGGAAVIEADGGRHLLQRHDALYLGRGGDDPLISSADPSDPAVLFIASYPAHAAHPSRTVTKGQARTLELGRAEDANRRTIRQYIHALDGGAASCQLVMGWTELHPGSVWNTFPPHTHDRRSEIYAYVELPPNGLVLHLMGRPDETRHLVVRERGIVLSPSWSCHCGAGSGAYRFAWAMGGENQAFDDMDMASLADLA